MKKLENFTNSLSILAEADFKLAEENDIYRTGIIGQSYNHSIADCTREI